LLPVPSTSLPEPSSPSSAAHADITTRCPGPLAWKLFSVESSKLERDDDDDAERDTPVDMMMFQVCFPDAAENDVAAPAAARWGPQGYALCDVTLL